MGQAIGGSLALAVGVALRPVPIIAVVLMVWPGGRELVGLTCHLGELGQGRARPAAALGRRAAVPRDRLPGLRLVGTLGVGICFALGPRAEKPLAGLKDWMGETA